MIKSKNNNIIMTNNTNNTNNKGTRSREEVERDEINKRNTQYRNDTGKMILRGIIIVMLIFMFIKIISNEFYEPFFFTFIGMNFFKWYIKLFIFALFIFYFIVTGISTPGGLLLGVPIIIIIVIIGMVVVLYKFNVEWVHDLKAYVNTLLCDTFLKTMENKKIIKWNKIISLIIFGVLSIILITDLSRNNLKYENTQVFIIFYLFSAYVINFIYYLVFEK